MKSKTTIEVNGKRYDAATGEVLSVAVTPPVRVSANIDGFFRPRGSAPSTAPMAPHKDSITVLSVPAPSPRPALHHNRSLNHARAHAPQPAKTAHVRVQSGAVHSQQLTVHRTPVAPNHTKHHDAQSSQTLMRSAVQRPTPSFHKQANAKATLQHAVPSLIVPKKSVATLDGERLVRAQTTAHSPFVAHHASQLHSSVRPVLADLSVSPVPEKPEAATPPTTPAPASKPTDIFEHALMNATHFVDIQAHKKHYKKKARAHALSMVAGTLALLVIVGFAAYQNTPGLQFKVASLRAGLSTTMPDFKAAGFAYNGVRSSDGKLMVGFKNAQGDYQLVQQATNLSGSDVIGDLGATDASGNPDYTTLQAGPTTIYRFTNTDATWVSGGTWYTVNGTGALSNQQVESLVQHV